MSGRATRRFVFKALLAGAVPLFSTLASRLLAVRAAENIDSATGWSFEGVTGPKHWSELSPDYAACQFGTEQSPIDLIDATKLTGPGALLIDYRPVTASVIRKSWTVEIAFDGKCAILISGKPYLLQHLQIRQPSEHLLSGRALEMELQLTHRAEDGSLAVTSIFVRQGKKNEPLHKVLEHTPQAGKDTGPSLAINPSDLLPPIPADAIQRPYYRYEGSLTVPPCTQGVIWIVFKQPIEALAKQIRGFAGFFPPNARPVSQIDKRILFEYDG